MNINPIEKKNLDMPSHGSTVLKKLKGLYISLDNLHKLANFKGKYKISESRLVNKALEEFFEKYEWLLMKGGRVNIYENLVKGKRNNI